MCVYNYVVSSCSLYLHPLLTMFFISAGQLWFLRGDDSCDRPLTDTMADWPMHCTGLLHSPSICMIVPETISVFGNAQGYSTVAAHKIGLMSALRFWQMLFPTFCGANNTVMWGDCHRQVAQFWSISSERCLPGHFLPLYDPISCSASSNRKARRSHFYYPLFWWSDRKKPSIM